jgi:hypothetical protein
MELGVASKGWTSEIGQLIHYPNIRQLSVHLRDVLPKHHNGVISVLSYNTCTHDHLAISQVILIALWADTGRGSFDRPTTYARVVAALLDLSAPILRRVYTGKQVLYL